MKIIGNKENVNQISLTHKGINARFNCLLEKFKKECFEHLGEWR